MVREDIMKIVNTHLGPYRIRGDECVCLRCPVCGGGQSANDKWTFSINLQTGASNCKRGSCGFSGSIYTLCKELNIEAPSGGRFMNFKQTKPRYALPNPSILKPLTEECRNYLKGRGISDKAIDDFQVASDERGNIIFPFYSEDGVLTFVKYRKPRKHTKEDGPKEWQISNTKQILFGMNMVSKHNPIYICEGECDALALYSANITNVLSIPCGSEAMDFIDNCWDFLEDCDSFVLMGDTDEAGQRCMQNICSRLGEDRCSYVDPAKYGETDTGRPLKDANEVLFVQGEDYLYNLAMSAEPVEVAGVLDIADVPLIDQTVVPRIKTGFPGLDDSLSGLAFPSITVLSSSSGMGKSTIASQILLYAMEQGYKVAAYSGELSAQQFKLAAYMQLASSEYTGLKYDPIKGKQVPHISPQVVAKLDDYTRNNMFLYDNNVALKDGEDMIDSIMHVLTTCVRRHGASVILIDNVLTATTGTNHSEYEAQSKLMLTIKRFSIKYNTAVIVVAHLRKKSAGDSGATMDQDNIAGNGILARLADNVVQVGKNKLCVLKSRATGILKTIEFVYLPSCRQCYQSDTGMGFVFNWDKEGVETANPRADSLPEYSPIYPQISSAF